MTLDFNLLSISKGLIETLVNFFRNFIYFLLNKQVAMWTFLVPDTAPLLPYLQNFFDYVENFCLYALDIFLIDSRIFSYLIGSLIFKISAPLIAYLIKLVIKWYNALKP